MSKKILVYAEHFNGKVEDITYEMIGKAKSISDDVVAVLIGNNQKDLTADLAAGKVIYVNGEGFENFNPQACCKVFASVAGSENPDMVLIGNTSMGMDLAAGVASANNMSLITYANDFDESTVTSQLYGGKMNVESCIAKATVVSVIPGSFPADDGKGAPGSIEEISAPDTGASNVSFRKWIQPEGGGVDITAQPILVSVGRGIQSEDNLPMAEELAEKLGGAVSCSRPIVDNKWLEKTRQVGKSGLKVKPKLYLALGISGAPEHIEGMKGADLIIAINTDANAPIFDYAHYGATEDLFDIIPALTEKL
jgi:electron transfer flavoprotein alpha subunit